MSKRPMTANAAAALEAAEGVAALGFGLYVGVETLLGEPHDPATAIGVTTLALAGGAGMLACARGLLRAEPWSRAPTVLTQLFALPIAWSLWQSEQYLIGVPLGVVAVLALVAVLAPPSTAWLVQDESDDGDNGDDDDAGGDDGDGAGGTGSADERPRSDA
ncbi:hypothetical protein [Actinomadura rudentiformis]|uniref:hypothetical protein n=1 Tax=Actinomadura rudentiformis TaxID=359158 RepID=UPI00178C17F7|nr:hypothetical protein [Actinomadura rudentiformis]